MFSVRKLVSVIVLSGLAFCGARYSVGNALVDAQDAILEENTEKLTEDKADASNNEKKTLVEHENKDEVADKIGLDDKSEILSQTMQNEDFEVSTLASDSSFAQGQSNESENSAQLLNSDAAKENISSIYFNTSEQDIAKLNITTFLNNNSTLVMSTELAGCGGLGAYIVSLFRKISKIKKEHANEIGKLKGELEKKDQEISSCELSKKKEIANITSRQNFYKYFAWHSWVSFAIFISVFTVQSVYSCGPLRDKIKFGFRGFVASIADCLFFRLPIAVFLPDYYRDFFQRKMVKDAGIVSKFLNLWRYLY